MPTHARWPRLRGGQPAAQKYWAPVGRLDNVYGDRNLFCSCVPVEDYA
jgi:glycine dehydrogenase